jgi:hypothetical protein
MGNRDWTGHFKCWGIVKGGMFSSALDDEKLRINKRLFLTATQRHIDIRKRDKDGDVQVQSMDDESLYGPRAHTLSFGAFTRFRFGLVVRAPEPPGVDWLVSFCQRQKAFPAACRRDTHFASGRVV